MFDAWIPVVVALVGSAGLWGYISQRSKQNHEHYLQQEKKINAFNETLQQQLKELMTEVKKLRSEKEELHVEIAGLREDLAKAKTVVEFFKQHFSTATYQPPSFNM